MAWYTEEQSKEFRKRLDAQIDRINGMPGISAHILAPREGAEEEGETHTLFCADIDKEVTAEEFEAVKGEVPLPLSVIPNMMGINLCCVSRVEWIRRLDGQLEAFYIRFKPAENPDCPRLPEDPYHAWNRNREVL